MALHTCAIRNIFGSNRLRIVYLYRIPHRFLPKPLAALLSIRFRGPYSVATHFAQNYGLITAVCFAHWNNDFGCVPILLRSL
jgi:hypothetical protein